MMGLGLGLGITGLAMGGGAADDSLRVSASPVLTAILDEPYAGFTVKAYGGTPPYTFSLSGTWPDGLAVDENTGVVSGTPEETGTFPGLSIIVEDSDMAAAQLNAFTITVSPAT